MNTLCNAFSTSLPNAFPCDVDNPNPVDPVNPITEGVNSFELCVTDSNDNPLENATVRVCSEQVTGPDGLVQFDLAPGVYTAEVIYNGRSRGTTEFNV